MTGLAQRPLHDKPGEFLAWQNERWRAARTAALPSSLSAHVLERAAALDAAGKMVSANQFVYACARELALSRFALDADAIRVKAATCAQHARRMSSPAVEELLAERHIAIPQGANVTPASRRRRYHSPDWWGTKLRHYFHRAAEDALRAAGLVGRTVSPYVSSLGLAAYQQAQARGRAFLEHADAVNIETGETLALKDLAVHSLANPAVRRAELMTKVVGLERFAQDKGHEWLFIVVTAPSRFHATLHTGAVNPAYRGASVRDGQLYHRENWARVRAIAKKRALCYYGLRTVEPHHDGTAHWNLLLFAAPAALRELAGLIRDAWLVDSPDEPGAQERRVCLTWGDDRRGSAAGYVAKYIAKGTDAHGLEADAEVPPAESAARCIAWSRIHRARQFQFFGSPRAGTWRELRRLRTPVDQPVIERVRRTTDEPADYGAYLTAQGWIAGRRDAVEVRDYADFRLELNELGLWKMTLTRWGEHSPPRTVGVAAPVWGERCITRAGTWRIVHRPTEAFIAGVLQLGLAWTRGNNCNPAPRGGSGASPAPEMGTGPPEPTEPFFTMDDIDPMVGF